MLSAAASDHRDRALEEIRSMVERVARDLTMLPAAVGKVRAQMPPPLDPISLDRLLDGRGRALRHARRSLAAMAPDAAGAAALADIHELVEEVRTGLSAPPILEDLAEMQAETAVDPARHALRALDTRVRRIGEQADALFAAVITVQQDLPAGATSMPTPTAPDKTDPTAEAVRDLGEMLASSLSGGAPAARPTRTGGGRHAAVADQIAASLDSFGLPHDGVQLPPDVAPDEVRTRLIDGLKRNFGWREAEGTRVYYRTAPQPVSSDAAAVSRLLRGSALVNANLLRAEADGVLAILDRLPAMLRFSPAAQQRTGEDRARLRTMLDQLIATASDPLGLNVQRGRYQFERLSAAILDLLVRTEVIEPATGDEAIAAARDRTAAGPWSAESEREALFDQLRVRTTVVREEEVRTEIAALTQLMDSIARRVALVSPRPSAGVAASRLEELLTAADGAAASLEAELARFGTSPAEQEVSFLDDGTVTNISLAQFIGWARALCQPFVGVENAAALLTGDELRILSDELAAIAHHTDRFAAASGVPTNLSGVRRQFLELRRFLDQARAQADRLGGDTVGYRGDGDTRTSFRSEEE